MAIDLTSVRKFPHFKVFSADVNANEIILPSQCTKVTVGSVANAIWVGQNDCTDGQTMPSDKFFVPANNGYPVKLGRGNSRATSIFVASQSGSATIYIALEET